MSSLSTLGTLLGLDKAEYLVTSTRTQKAAVSPRLAETFSVVTPAGDEPTDWDKMQDRKADLLDHHRKVTRDASNVHRSAKVKVKQIRRRRNRTANGLRLYYRGLKTNFEATYEIDVAELVGLDAPPERKPFAFREQLIDVVERVRDPSLVDKLGSSREGSALLDLEALGLDLEGRVGVLDAVLAELTEAEKVRDEALVVRNEARRQLRRVTVNIARIQEGYYRLVGLDDLADRLRLSIRARPSRPEGPGSEPPDGGEGPEPPNGGEGPEPPDGGEGPVPGGPGGPPPVDEPSI